MAHPQTITNIAHMQKPVGMAAALPWTARLRPHEAVANPFSLAVDPDGALLLINPNERPFNRIKASDLLLLDANDPGIMDMPDVPDQSARHQEKLKTNLDDEGSNHTS